MKKVDEDPYQTRSEPNASDLRIIDRLAAAFDQAWQKGQQPRIEAYLNESPQCVRDELFKSLLRIELATRRKQGKVAPGDSGGLKAPTPGDWLRGHYVLLEMVGRGGMGEVFKAYRFSLRQEVALKIVRYDRFVILSPPKQHQILDAFREEMQATARLHH